MEEGDYDEEMTRGSGCQCGALAERLAQLSPRPPPCPREGPYLLKKISGFLQRLLLGLATLFLLLLGPSCQGAPGSGDAAPTPVPTEGEGLGMVWEAWGILEEAYGDEEALDRERAVEGAILGMLRTVDQRPYPFLTELHTVEEEPPKKMPPGLEDIWHTWVLLSERHDDAAPEEIAEAAVEGLTEGLDDPHAGFMTQHNNDPLCARIFILFDQISTRLTVLCP